MFYIYILHSRSIDKYYVGHTENVTKRLLQHNNPRKPNKYTSKTQDWELVLSISAGESRSQAMLVEKYIKKQKSRKFIENLIHNADSPKTLAQLVRVPTCRD